MDFEPIPEIPSRAAGRRARFLLEVSPAAEPFSADSAVQGRFRRNLPQTGRVRRTVEYEAREGTGARGFRCRVRVGEARVRPGRSKGAAPHPISPPPGEGDGVSLRPGPSENGEARTMKSPARKGEAVVSDPAVSDAPPHASRRRRWPWVVGVAVLALVAFLVLRSGKKGATQAAAAARAQASRAVPVVAVPAKSGDMAVFLTGLGTVTAINTVTVRSRVDGQLIRIGFREGQLVHQGELLAEIAPRPFQVQLIQAEGQRGKDEATLANARVDLKRYQVLVQQDAIPKQQLDTQIATVNQLEATLKSDQGGIESAKLNLAYSRITAPITGTVGLKLVDPGNIVHANDPT